MSEPVQRSLTLPRVGGVRGTVTFLHVHTTRGSRHFSSFDQTSVTCLALQVRRQEEGSGKSRPMGEGGLPRLSPSVGGGARGAQPNVGSDRTRRVRRRVPEPWIPLRQRHSSQECNRWLAHQMQINNQLQTSPQTNRQTDKHTNKHTNKNKHTHTLTNTQTNNQPNKRKKQTNKQNKHKHKHKHTNKQTHKHTNKQTNNQTSNQTNNQTNNQTKQPNKPNTTTTPNNNNNNNNTTTKQQHNTTTQQHNNTTTTTTQQPSAVAHTRECASFALDLRTILTANFSAPLFDSSGIIPSLTGQACSCSPPLTASQVRYPIFELVDQSGCCSSPFGAQARPNPGRPRWT